MLRRRQVQMVAAMGGAEAYWQKVLGTQADNLVGLWRLNETSGTDAADSSPEGNDGTYSNVTLSNSAGPDGVLVPSFNGTTSYINVVSAGLIADISKTAGTLSFWCKPVNASYWAAAGSAWLVRFDFANSGNTIYIAKTSGGNIDAYYKAGATTKTVGLDPTGGDGVFLGMTWNTTADALIGYKNGAQVGSTQTGLAAPAGDLSLAVIGASTAVPDSVFSGWIGIVGLWTATLTPAEMSSIHTV